MSNEVRNVSISISASGGSFDSDNIVRVDMQRGITDGGFGIGFTQSDMLRFTAVSSAKLAKKALCTVTISPGGRFGNYYVEECTRDGSMINVTAYDAMYYQGKAHVRFGGKASLSLEPLTFPCTMQDVLDYVCALRRIPCGFQCQDFTIPKKPKKPDGTYFTVRELIGFIAASHGCNAKFNNQGVLEFRGFSESNEEMTVSDVVDITIDDSEPFEVTGLLFYVDSETDVYIDDVPGSAFDEDDDGIIKCYNPLVTVDSEGNCPVANYAWSQISGSRLSYYSGSITRRGSGTVNCGDVLTIKDLKYPSDSEDYMICITDISYSISADTGFMETLTSQADKNDNGSPPTSNSKLVARGKATDPAQETGSDVKLSDLWFKTDNSGKLTTIYQRTQNDTTNEKEWKYVCTVAGGGVGENVGYHNERFNGYTAEDGCVIQGGSYYDYNHAEGYKNTLTACGKTHVSGKENAVTGADGAVIFGQNNTITALGAYYILGGYNNEVRAGISGSAIFGASHRIYEQFSHSLMAGQSNQVLGSTDYTIVVGNANTVIGGSGDAIFGQSHKVVYGTGGINHILVCGTAADTTTLNVGAGNIRFLVGNAGNIFCIDGDGECYAAGGYSAMGADYAEYFEWADGNPENEDRCGMLVALDGDKIVPADGYDILGAVSADPSVVGNSPDLFWRGKYARDIYGRIIHTPKGEALINPDYDPEQQYIPRSARPEWSAVGLVGRLIVRDNGSCKAGEWVVGNNGYAFPCLVGKTNVRCLRRVDDTHIEVLIR